MKPMPGSPPITQAARGRRVGQKSKGLASCGVASLFPLDLRRFHRVMFPTAASRERKHYLARVPTSISIWGLAYIAGMDVQSWEPKRSLEERVLVHLTNNGPRKWATVYMYFDQPATGEIGPVLRVLEDLKQIKCDDKGYVKITQTGFDRITKQKIGPPS